MRMPVSTPVRDEVAQELRDRLRGFVGRRVADPHAADDLVQDVLLRLHGSLGELRAHERLDAFAYQVARNAIVDHYRARARAKEAALAPDELTARVEAEDAVDGGLDESQGRQELARCLEPLVAGLPEAYREALVLTDLGELSQVQAAERLGVSVSGMKSRVQRARLQVREQLTRCCEIRLDGTRQIADVQRTGPCACTRPAD
jgi:RNA polymerase sigma-70 factor (ECF subfamily)